MKKLIIALVSAILVITLCASFVSADTKNLVLSDAEWYQQDVNGVKCTIDFSSGKPVISGSTAGTWPAVYATYAPEKCIVADIDKYSLHYDFEFATGCTNITFIFSKDNGTPDNGYEFPLSNTALKGAEFNSGSGDLQAAHYSGNIKLSDLVDSSTNLDNTAFDKSFVVDGKLIFSGLRIFSVDGAAITINALELVLNDDATTPPTESGEATDSSDDSSSAESSVAASSDESTESIVSTVSTESKTEESKPASSADTSSSSGDISETNSDKGGFPYWIIAVVLAVIVVAIVCVRFVGKGKNK